jgi:hypothetical protein
MQGTKREATNSTVFMDYNICPSPFLSVYLRSKVHKIVSSAQI